MLAGALIAVPALAGALAFLLRDDRLRRWLLLVAALVHAGLTVAAWFHRFPAAPGDWLTLDSTGVFFLSITSLLFLLIALHTAGYLGNEEPHAGTGSQSFSRPAAAGARAPSRCARPARRAGRRPAS